MSAATAEEPPWMAAKGQNHGPERKNRTFLSEGQSLSPLKKTDSRRRRIRRLREKKIEFNDTQTFDSDSDGAYYEKDTSGSEGNDDVADNFKTCF